MSGPSKPPLSEYSEALRVYHLAAAEWLGLDPAKVFRLKVNRGRPPGFRVEVHWKSDERLTPRVGHAGPPNVESDGGTITFSGSVVLDYDDGRTFLDAIGPEPEMFTAEEKAQMVTVGVDDS